MIGTTLQNRYRLDAELGRGGMGVVYRARDTLLERDVALKLVAAESLGTEGQSRLLQEAQAAASLNHPHIIAIYDAGLAKATGGEHQAAYIVMELIDGHPLSDYQVQGLEEILAIASQIAAALEAAHERGIIHRDLKPENVLVSSVPTPAGETLSVQVKLMDFGLARITGRTRLTQEGALVGTMDYIAPEIILGQPATEQTDLYSFGVLLYELAAERPPFDGDTPTAILSQHLHAPVTPPNVFNESLPSGLSALIVDLMSKNPDKRPASAAEVSQALLRLQAEPSAADYVGLDPLERLVRGRLFGRDRELAEAQELWQSTVSSNGRTLLVSGEPGIGKTSLVRELSTIVELTGGQTLIGACFPETGAPYAPFAQIVQAALHGGNGNLALPEFVLAELISLAPELRLSYPDVPPNPPLDPEAGQRRLFDSLIIFSQVLSQRQPLLLVIEDAHWADDGSLAIMQRLARRGQRQPVLIVATYREVELDRNLPLNKVLMELQREGLANRLKLTRLNRADTGKLLSQLFAEEITTEFLDAIYRETEGNPFFIEEVCRALVESGELYFRDGIWHRPPMHKLAIPQSVRIAIQSRVAALDESLQDVLRLAAILGREFDFDTLMAAGSWDEDTLIDALEQAEQAQLIEEVSSERGATFAFVHALIPSTLAEELSGLRQRRMHRQVAQVIEEMRPDDWPTLAHHFRRAQDRQKAFHYLSLAGDQAAERFALEDAVRFYNQAFDFAHSDEERFDLITKRVAVHHLAAHRDEEWADIEEMAEWVDLLNDDGRRVDVLLAQATYHRDTKHVLAVAPARRAAKIARDLNDPVREARALTISGQANAFSNNLSQSRSDLEEAVELFLAAELRGEASLALHSLSLTLVNLGLNQEALEVGLRALDISRQAGDKLQEATSLRRVAIALSNEHRYNEAQSYAQEALDLHRQLGDRAEEVNALNVLSIVYYRLEEADKASPLVLESLALAEEIETSVGIQYATFNYSYYTALNGHYELALRKVTEVAEKYASSPDKWLAGSLASTLAIFLNILGQYDQALSAMERALPLLEGVDTPGSRAGNLSFASIMCAEGGKPELARTYARQAAETAANAGAGDALDFFYLWRARLYLVLQTELDSGLSAVKHALDHAHAFSNDYVHVHALGTKARLHLALNQLVEALETIEELQPHMGVLDARLRMQELWWTRYLVLSAAAREEEAVEALKDAHKYNQMVANNIEDHNLRQGWLENVPDNLRIAAEVAKLGLDSS